MLQMRETTVQGIYLRVPIDIPADVVKPRRTVSRTFMSSAVGLRLEKSPTMPADLIFLRPCLRFLGHTDVAPN